MHILFTFKIYRFLINREKKQNWERAYISIFIFHVLRNTFFQFNYLNKPNFFRMLQMTPFLHAVLPRYIHIILFSK